MEEWLKLLNLSCYYETLCKQNYDTVDKVTQLTWEDLEDFGISKLGHQKKILLAIKRIKNLARAAEGGEPIYGVTSSPYTTKPLESPSASRPNMLITNNSVPTPERTNSSYELSFQNVPIKINTLNSPTTGEMRIIEPVTPIIIHNNNMPNRMFVEPRGSPLSTFQQQMNHQTPFHPRLVPNTSYYRPVIQNGQQMMHNNLRGRSMENLTTTDLNYYNQYYAPVAPPMHGNGGGLQYPQPYYQYSNGDIYSLANRQAIQSSFLPNNTFNNNVNQNYALQSLPQQQQFNNYEVDGTATLNRPTSFAKPKPLARIINDNFDAASIKSNDSASTLSTISNDRNGLNSDSGSDTSSIYSITKKNPPPPPKRVNSVVGKKSNSSSVPSTPLHQPNKMFAGEPFFNAYDDIGVFNSYTASEDLFATCVKSLTNKFSEMHALSPQSDQPKKVTESPTTAGGGNCTISQPIEQNYKTLPLNKKEKSAVGNNNEGIAASSSSSTESMPFANDNIGTIRQKNSLIMQNAMKMFDTGSKGSASSSSSSSSTTSPMFNPNKSMVTTLGAVGLDVSPPFPPPPPPLQQHQTKDEENTKQR